jgi:hypothetical protein
MSEERVINIFEDSIQNLMGCIELSQQMNDKESEELWRLKLDKAYKMLHGLKANPMVQGKFYPEALSDYDLKRYHNITDLFSSFP